MQNTLQINGSTRLSDLLSSYPFLREHLPKVNERFQMLNTPIAKVMIKKATVAEMSKRSGMEESALIQAIRNLIGLYA